MKLYNFENYTTQTIFQRGYVYYLEGRVINLSSNADGEYQFTVEGRTDYNVVVKLGADEEIVYSDCNCPFDFDTICKHQIAAYFELRDQTNKNHNTKTQEPSLKEVLSNLSKEDLITIIEDITANDLVLTNKLLLKYSSGTDAQEIQYCKQAIQSIVHKYIGRHGMIPYSDTFRFANELSEILEKAQDTYHILRSIDIASLVLIEGMEAFQYSDDSGGEIGSLVNEAIKQIEELALSCDDGNVKEEALNKILHLSQHEVFNGWEDFSIDLLRVCIHFAEVPVLRNKITAAIHSYLTDEAYDDYIKYYKESLLNIEFDLLRRFGTKEETEQFLKEHLEYSSFRRISINQLLQEANYEKAIELALEGEKKDKGYSGLATRWKEFRYKAYKGLGWKKEQEKLGKELLLNGDFDYYRELKDLVHKDQKTFYTQLKQELKHSRNRQANAIYLQLIEEEEDIDAIMEYVKEHPENIESYADMLIGKFPEDVTELYTHYIKAEAQMASNRKAYQSVCRKLKNYSNTIGREKTNALKDELRVLYKRRPAFIDELGKV